MSHRGSRSSSVSTVSGTIKQRNVEEALAMKGGQEEEGGGEVGGGMTKGLSFGMTAFFLVAQMAGAGFLSLPKAVANAGWLGIPLMIIFCVAVGFSGTRLGKSWVILEERWPESYRNIPCRQPYMEIADRAMGKIGRGITLAAVVLTLVGNTIVYLILMASFMNNLVNQLSTCEWVLICAAVVLPFTWLGTPKDFWQTSVLAVVSTVLACIVIFIEILIEKDSFPDPVYQNPTIRSFALGFGAILFAYGGASVFPTIQNDMADRSKFGRSIVVGFSVILSLYLPVAVTGYVVLGVDVEDNILFSVNTEKGIIKAAMIMEIINLLGTYIISFNPIGQVFEDMLSIESKFGWKRCLVRSGIVVFEVIIGLAVPDFGKVLNLIGGSTVTLCSFVLPPLAYMWLVDMKNDNSWPEKRMEPWERIALWMIIFIGVVGGVTSTVTAFIDILSPDSMTKSCFADFSPDPEAATFRLGSWAV